MVIFSTNLLMYVFFGVFLIVLSLALYDRLKSGAPAIMQVGTAIGIIWAGSLIASGMVANAGIAPVVALYAKDPAQAALTWQGIESVASGLGNGNGEILGGLWALLVSLAALRAGGLPKGLNILGLLVGAVGILSIIPGLTDLTGVFGLSQIIWFVWLGIVLLRNNLVERCKTTRTVELNQKGEKINTAKGSSSGTSRTNSAIVRVLFIIGTTTGIAAAMLGSPILDAPEYLSKIVANEGTVVSGAFTSS